MKTRNLRRALWLCLPILVLAGALWVLKIRRPVEVTVPASVGTRAMLGRLSDETARNRFATWVTVAQSDNRMNGSSFQFNRRAETFTYKWWSFSSNSWNLQNVSETALHTSIAETLRLHKTVGNLTDTEILRRRLQAHGAKYKSFRSQS